MLKPSGLNDCIICKRGAVVGYPKAPKENFLLRPEFHLFWTVHNCMSLRKLASREGHTVFFVSRSTIFYTAILYSRILVLN